MADPACSRRRALATLAACPAVGALAALPVVARANVVPPPEVAHELPGVRLAGVADLRVLLLHVYDARLWVGSGFTPQRYDAAPLALEIAYARALVGRLIAERSLQEMQRVPGIAPAQAEAWLAFMTRTFPDVARGDRITGVQRPGEGARFFFNGTLRGELRDADFARRFFGIWLAPHTSEPALRERLLGGAGATT